MKSYILAITLLIPAIILGASAKVELGQTQQQVIDALGKPLGMIELSNKTRLLYPEGEVLIRDGAVAKIDLMTDEQFANEQQRLQQEREEWAIQKEKRAAGRVKAAEELKAYKLQSSSFAALPAQDRIDYWRSFQSKYPEVDVSSEIAQALQSYEVEIAELKNQQRIAELEANVVNAQNEATKARMETEKLRQEAEARKTENFGLRDYYITPYQPYYRPRTVIINSSGSSTCPKPTPYNSDLWKYNNGNNNNWNNYLPTQRSRSNIGIIKTY